MSEVEDFVKKCLIDLGSEYHCITLEILLLSLGLVCILIAVIIVINYLFRGKNE